MHVYGIIYFHVNAGIFNSCKIKLEFVNQLRENAIEQLTAARFCKQEIHLINYLLTMH